VIVDRVDPQALEAALSPPLAGPVEWHSEVGSTNDLAAALARSGSPEGTVVGADHQTAGRGRRGRDWQDGGSDIAMSLILRPGRSRAASLLPLLVALGVAEGLAGLVEDRVELIWPNDVVTGGRKLSGILCELAWQAGVAQWVVAGVGINVGPVPPVPDARWQPASLREGGFMGSRQDVVRAVLGAIGRYYSMWQAVGGAGVVSGFASRDALKGRTIEVDLDDGSGLVSGEAAGIDPQGRLRVLTSEGERQFAAGEVVRVGH
jgi:BirA family biotin operon repressor/biotin-[acetyl-CoA-carboxylase] ligase